MNKMKDIHTKRYMFIVADAHRDSLKLTVQEHLHNTTTNRNCRKTGDGDIGTQSDYTYKDRTKKSHS